MTASLLRRVFVVALFVLSGALIGVGCGEEAGGTADQLPAAALDRPAAALTGPQCTTAPDKVGAHPKHAGYACSVCHQVGGALCFDPAGPAVKAGAPAPTFDFTLKTCSNVACHGVPAGTYSYYFPGNETDPDGYPIPELKTVNYGGTMAASTPSWYATGAGCTACHGNPPANGSDGSNAWHSGNHAGSQNFSMGGGLVLNANQCELCHNRLQGSTYSPIAQSAVGPPDGKYHGTAILIPALHGDGAVSVVARFRPACFGCH
jgi:hypothetical protein